LFGSPDFFANTPTHEKSVIRSTDFLIDKDKKIKMLKEHLELFDELLLKPEHKAYHVMKKHFKAYVNGWRGAKELRAKLMQTNTPNEAREILNAVV
jgi:tRNA-dihydrouridine synthase